MKQAKEELKSQSSTKVKKRAKIGFNKVIASNVDGLD